jgi:ribonuclease HII
LRSSDNLVMSKFAEELACISRGYHLIAGIDEVGRGCLAGPVVASAVIMQIDKSSKWFKQVRDSKLLSAKNREFLSGFIHATAISIGTGVVAPDVIDKVGMTRAVGMAMKKALDALTPRADFALIDYFTISDLDLPQKGVIDGDTLCFSIACASIVAKVFRDNLMQQLDREYHGYELARHKGYGTLRHLACLRQLGPSPIHRRSFQPVKEVIQPEISQLQLLEVKS